VSEIIAFAVPVFLLLLVVEALAHRLRPRPGARGYDGRDAATSLALGAANVVMAGLLKVASVAAFGFAWEYRIFDLGSSVAAWGLLLLSEDLCYYVFHRLHHEVRLLWAAHVNHHSSRFYNLSTALRQSWSTPLTGLIFWLPLALLGFHPVMILTAQAVSLIYQFWLHTELLGRLGPFEWLFNTPSHHRVHHGRNVEYLDRNYGGILIVWDRIFGSFEPERAPVDYGLTKNLQRPGVLHAALHEWQALLRDVSGASTWRQRMEYALRPPGWSPDGATLTAAQMQRAIPRS
jgi:sterol desaturase/sphingolipid hydroxylase (fatty acid hydroxylase superfamily)